MKTRTKRTGGHRGIKSSLVGLNRIYKILLGPVKNDQAYQK